MPVALVTATTLASTGLAFAAGPSAQAAPAPQVPAAPTPVSPKDQRLAVPSGSASVTINGVRQTQFAHLVASAPFTVAGLTWNGLTGTPHLQLRALTASGWSAWTDADADGAGTGAGGSDAIFTGSATRVEVRGYGVGGASARGLKVSLINSTATAADQQVATASVARISATRQAVYSGPTYATPPTIITRAQWGADESLVRYNGSSCVTPTYDQTIKAAVVHHTDGSNNYTAAQSAAIVRGIYAFHVKDRGWCDVGYNFLVDKYGQIFQGRHGDMTLAVHGAHATLWNTNTVGVSVMMNSDTAPITAAAQNSLARVIAWKLAGNYVDPNAKVYLVNGTYNTILRHGDVMSTSCPGKNITASMPAIRAAVTTLMGTWKTPIYQAWQARGGAGGTLGVPHQVEQSYAGGRITVFTGGALIQLPGTTTIRWMGAAIYKKYAALGGAAKLGFPLASQVAGTATGSAVLDLPNGRSIASSSGGTWLTTSAIKAAWWNNATAQARIGTPIADAVVTATGSYQLFQFGRIDVTGTSAPRFSFTSVWGDVNHDGIADVTTLASGGSSIVFRLTSAGVARGTLAGPTGFGAADWVAQVPDLDADGRPELVARRTDGSLWLSKGTGTGTYAAPVRIGLGWSTMRELTIVPGMTGTRQTALLSIDSTGRLVRYTFMTTGRLVDRTVLATGWGNVVQLASVGDLDRNGSVDLLTVNTDSRLYLRPTTRAGALTGASTFISRGWIGFSRLWSPGDLTGDGRPDLLAARPDGSLRVYKNTGTGLSRVSDYLPRTNGLRLIG